MNVSLLGVAGMLLDCVATPWVAVPLVLLIVRRMPPVGLHFRAFAVTVFAMLVVLMLAPRDAVTGRVIEPKDTLTALCVLAMCIAFSAVVLGRFTGR